MILISVWAFIDNEKIKVLGSSNCASWLYFVLFFNFLDLTVENLESFIPRFLSHMHLEFLIHGNVSKEKAEEVSEMVISHMAQHSHTKPLLPSQLVRQREYQLPLGKMVKKTKLHNVNLIKLL